MYPEMPIVRNGEIVKPTPGEPIISITNAPPPTVGGKGPRPRGRNRTLKDGFLVYGKELKGGLIIYVDTPMRGYVLHKSKTGCLDSVPFRYPCLCKNLRKAVARAGPEFETKVVNTISPNTYLVVLDIKGQNR
eukprot:UN01948